MQERNCGLVVWPVHPGLTALVVSRPTLSHKTWNSGKWIQSKQDLAKLALTANGQRKKKVVSYLMEFASFFASVEDRFVRGLLSSIPACKSNIYPQNLSRCARLKQTTQSSVQLFSKLTKKISYKIAPS